MIIFPAIDIRNGKCVRLTQGKFDAEDIYSDNPVEIAVQWQEQGAKYLHVVDLDGALHGMSMNTETIKKIVQSVEIPVQVGGGIRKLEDIKRLVELGVSRIILGTSAVNKEGFLVEALKAYKEKVVVSIDTRNGYIAVEGWTQVSKLNYIDFTKKLEKMGVKTLIYTDIAKDGMLAGPNFEAIKYLKENVKIDLIASGGISTKEHVHQLKALEIYGAIIGKALYTEDIKLKEL
ncbi:1-(5-phosphoribosyl)-5-[(5-phosphoribosylamino)methylideneamino]imidazole-4-carboxamide isomerase [Clostridiaceae bacterium 35-E11]